MIKAAKKILVTVALGTAVTAAWAGDPVKAAVGGGLGGAGGAMVGQTSSAAPPARWSAARRAARWARQSPRRARDVLAPSSAAPSAAAPAQRWASRWAARTAQWSGRASAGLPVRRSART